MELTIIHSKIHEIREQKVMLDFDLAVLYDVQTKVLNQAVKRNIERFPEDFICESRVEFAAISLFKPVSSIVILNEVKELHKPDSHEIFGASR